MCALETISHTSLSSNRFSFRYSQGSPPGSRLSLTSAGSMLPSPRVTDNIAANSTPHNQCAYDRASYDRAWTRITAYIDCMVHARCNDRTQKTRSESACPARKT